MKNDNAFEDLDDQSPAAATADTDETETQDLFGAPPEGHRIRVDAADLEQEPGESDAKFAQRQREYESAPDPFSPTGRKKGKIYLYDFDVKCIGSKGVGAKPAPARIKGVPAPSDAIREFMILRGIPYAAPYRFRVFPVPGTKIDGGDKAYSAAHVPDGCKRPRLPTTHGF